MPRIILAFSNTNNSTYLEFITCQVHCFKCFTYNNKCNVSNDSTRKVLLSHFTDEKTKAKKVHHA